MCSRKRLGEEFALEAVEGDVACLYNLDVRSGVYRPELLSGLAIRQALEPEVHPVQVTVSVRHGDLDNAIQSQLQEKANKLLTYFERLTSILVTVDLHQETGGQICVEILARAEHKHEFVAREHDADLVAAFNLASDKIKQQLRHHKERLQDHRRDPSHNDSGAR